MVYSAQNITPRGHGAKVNRRVDKQQCRQLAAFQYAPQNIRDVIDQNSKQESPVNASRRRLKSSAAIQKDIVVDTQQHDDREHSNSGIVHTLLSSFQNTAHDLIATCAWLSLRFPVHNIIGFSKRTSRGCSRLSTPFLLYSDIRVCLGTDGRWE